MRLGDGMRIGDARASGYPAMPLHKASAPAGPRPVVDEVSDATCAASALAGTSRRISQHSGRPHTIGAVVPARGFEGRAPGLRTQPPGV